MTFQCFQIVRGERSRSISVTAEVQDTFQGKISTYIGYVSVHQKSNVCIVVVHRFLNSYTLHLLYVCPKMPRHKFILIFFLLRDASK